MNTKWSVEDDELLKENLSLGKTIEQICFLFKNRTVNAIRHRTRSVEFDNENNIYRPWDKDDIDILENMIKNGDSPGNIAKKLNRTVQSVGMESRIRKFEKLYEWDDKLDKLLIKYVNSGKSKVENQRWK